MPTNVVCVELTKGKKFFLPLFKVYLMSLQVRMETCMMVPRKPTVSANAREPIPGALGSTPKIIEEDTRTPIDPN